MFGLWVW